MAVTQLEKRIDLFTATEALPKEQKQWLVILRRFARHRLAVISSFLILFVMIVCLFARIIAPFTAVELELGNTFATPFTSSESGRMHWLGTDHQGRDLLPCPDGGDRLPLRRYLGRHPLTQGLSAVNGGGIGSCVAA